MALGRRRGRPRPGRGTAPVSKRGQGALFMALPTGQDAGDGLAVALGAKVDFRAETAATAPERLRAPFFRAPAACWWARMTLHPRSAASSPAPHAHRQQLARPAT